MFWNIENAVGGTKDRLTHREYVADYLLFRLNNNSYIKKYVELYELAEPTDNIHFLLKHIAVKYNMKRGERMFKLTRNPDDLLHLEQAINMFIDDFRCGKLGPITLDNCSIEYMQHFFEHKEVKGDPVMEDLNA